MAQQTAEQDFELELSPGSFEGSLITFTLEPGGRIRCSNGSYGRYVGQEEAKALVQLLAQSINLQEQANGN